MATIDLNTLNQPLFEELKNSYPDIPENVIADCMIQHSNNRLRCIEYLSTTTFCQPKRISSSNTKSKQFTSVIHAPVNVTPNSKTVTIIQQNLHTSNPVSYSAFGSPSLNINNFMPSTQTGSHINIPNIPCSIASHSLSQGQSLEQRSLNNNSSAFSNDLYYCLNDLSQEIPDRGTHRRNNLNHSRSEDYSRGNTVDNYPTGLTLNMPQQHTIQTQFYLGSPAPLPWAGSQPTQRRVSSPTPPSHSNHVVIPINHDQHAMPHSRSDGSILNLPHRSPANSRETSPNYYRSSGRNSPKIRNVSPQHTYADRLLGSAPPNYNSNLNLPVNTCSKQQLSYPAARSASPTTYTRPIFENHARYVNGQKVYLPFTAHGNVNQMGIIDESALQCGMRNVSVRNELTNVQNVDPSSPRLDLHYGAITNSSLIHARPPDVQPRNSLDEKKYIKALLEYQSTRFKNLLSSLQDKLDANELLKKRVSQMEENMMDTRERRTQSSISSNSIHSQVVLFKGKNRELLTEITSLHKQIEQLKEIRKSQNFYQNMNTGQVGSLQPPRVAPVRPFSHESSRFPACSSSSTRSSSTHPPGSAPPSLPSGSSTPFRNSPSTAPVIPPRRPVPPTPVENLNNIPPAPAPQSRSSSDENEGAQWDCKACTYLNHPSLNKCEMCLMSRQVIGMRIVPINSACYCHQGRACMNSALQ